MRLLIDDDSTCSKDRACAQQPDKTGGCYLARGELVYRHAINPVLVGGVPLGKSPKRSPDMHGL